MIRVSVDVDVARPQLAAPQLTRPANPALVLVGAAAAVLIGYGYLVGLWTDAHGEHLALLDLVRTWVARPLGLGEDFGPLGVLLLLAASGYAVASGARVTRLLPPLAVTAVLALVVPDATVLPQLWWAVALAVLGWAASMTLARAPQRWLWMGYLAQLVVAADVVALAGAFEALHSASAVAAFYPLVVAGQLIHAVRSRTIPAWAGGLFGLGCYAVLGIADHIVPAFEGWWYPVAASYAGLLLAVAVTFAGRTASTLAAHPAVRWAAERVWWLALLVGVLGHPLLTALHAVLPVGIASLLAVLGTGMAAELAHRGTELGVALVRRRRAS